jgi:hypothetical protein
MAKKHEILDRLSALKPGVPTSTRKGTPSHESPTVSPTTENPLNVTATVEKAATKRKVSPVRPPRRRRKESVEPPAGQTTVIAAEIPSEAIEEAVHDLPAPSADVTVMETRPGYLSIMSENITALERLREVLIEEMGRVSAVMLDSWRQSMIITYDVFRMNQDYLFNLIYRSFAPNFPDDKK